MVPEHEQSVMIKSVALIAPRQLPRPVSPHARKGLRFETGFIRALRAAAPAGFTVVSNHWFEFRRAWARSNDICVPDAIIEGAGGEIIVVECKLTFTPLARKKLDEIYLPVVGAFYGCSPRAVVVVKNLLPNCPAPASKFRFAFEIGLFQWDMRSRVVW